MLNIERCRIPIFILIAFLIPISGCAARKTGPNSHQSLRRSDGAIKILSVRKPASAQNPAFSPDSKTIIFTLFKNGYNKGPAGLHKLSRSTKRIVKLIDEPGQDSVNLPGSCWNLTTGRITFSSDRRGVDEIWTVKPDGSGLFRVTSHGMRPFFVEPSFSPDGRWIVFEADERSSIVAKKGSIWKVRSNGKELTELTGSEKTGADNGQPSWAPKGDRILFQQIEPLGDNWNIMTMTPNGKDIKAIISSPSNDTDASWSPDGKWIVYSSDIGGLPYPNIFIIPSSGGKPFRLTRSDENEDCAPSWSPDGKWIAFESHPGKNENSPASLWIIEAPKV